MERRLELIFEMTPAIWLHLCAAVVSLVIGAFVLWRRKGDWKHKLLGRIWVATMFVVAISSFFIAEIRDGKFSPIHALSVWTLVSLAAGIWVVRNRKNISYATARHQAWMQSLYATGMLIAGGFTFLPDRLLGRLTFGESLPIINIVIVTAMVLVGILLLINSIRPILKARS